MRLETYQNKLFSTDNWIRRRRVVYLSLGFLGFWISYILVIAQDIALYRDTVSTMIFAGVGIIMTYCFGAVADDWDKRKKLDPPPAQDVIPQTDPTAVPPGAPG
jgi:hypothetical protein